MQRDGFNINRVFLDELPNRGIGGLTNSTAPLDPDWLSRLSQYIADADSYGIYTMVTMVYVPDNNYFRNVSARAPPVTKEWHGSTNQGFLTPNGHAMYVEYASQLGAALKVRLPTQAQSAVLFSLQNEFSLQGNQYPFGTKNGTVQLADGATYDMAIASDRQQAADANTNLWAKRLRDVIRSHLPSALVTVGVFTFQAVHKAGPNGLLFDGCQTHNASPSEVDCRFPARPLILTHSGIDFLDVHIDQPDGSAAALEKNLATEEWRSIRNETPVIMGEFGCNYQWYPNATACAPHVRELQITSCAFGFSGWLFWQYDCTAQVGWYTMIDDDSAIYNALAPSVNPHPCTAF
jgi:hypothetical protein